MRRARKATIGFIAATFAFDAARARYIWDAGGGRRPAGAVDLLQRFFAGEPFPAPGASLVMPVDWLLLILPLIGGCACVFEDLLAPRSTSRLLRVGTRRRAWIRACRALLGVAACWLAAAVASVALVYAVEAFGGMATPQSVAAPLADGVLTVALEVSAAFLVVLLQACVSVAFGAIVGAAASFCLAAASCVSRCVWLPHSWMMLVREPWFCAGDESSARVVAALLSTALSVALLAMGGALFARKDLLPDRRMP